MLSIHSFVLFTLMLKACASTIGTRDSCGKGYVPCTPKGASNAAEDVVHLYNNLVNTVATASHFKRDAVQTGALVERAAPLCCAEGMQCLLLDVDKVPFCWDQFTTNVYFADGWYGSITTGNFTTPSGETVNLITGDYADKPGNIYSADAAAKPNTVTMSLPSPWTSKGVGSAIPASALGAPATYTTTVPGTTRHPSTIPAETVPATTVDGCVIPATTKPATTIPGTTVSGRVTVVTDAAATSSTDSGAADTDHPRHLGGILAAGLIVLLFV
ncbi:hypothetical protein VTN00DRAFT_10046 [Thermoascus crustaceus]|uniref:uncharacterized protein n=1 Tax=Thermoascus crustaceus TaxID=5088 RepID=UPI0037443A62